jgi:hypothetical protein
MQQTNIGILNHNVLDGEPRLVFDRAPDIKLSNAPKIVFAIPVGGKRLTQRFQCNKEHGGCGVEWEDVPTAVTPNVVPAAFMLSYHSLQMPLNVSSTFLVESGRLSSESRQIMTKVAIRMGAKYIVYWDDDILPPPDALYRLYNFMEKNPEVGITTSVCTTRVEPVEPVIYAAHGDGASWDFECGPGAIPTPIMFGGAGFIIARVSAIVDAIEKLKAENGGVEVPVWADERLLAEYEGTTIGIKKRNIFWGHDVRFYRLIREAGYHTVVHGAVICQHLDPMTNRVYTMPQDAPGFKMVHDRLQKENEHAQETH